MSISYLNSSLTALFLDEQVTADTERRARRNGFTNTGHGVGQVTVLVFLAIFKETYQAQ
mgnify:CR=1 FL=1